MARIPSNNIRTGVATTSSTADLVTLTKNHLTNLRKQLKTLRGWQKNLGGFWLLPADFGQRYVSFKYSWFKKPTDPANFPGSSLPWYGKEEGKYYVFTTTPIFENYSDSNPAGELVIFDQGIRELVTLWQSKIKTAEAELARVTGAGGPSSDSSTTIEDTTKYTYISKKELDLQTVLVNVGSVKEAYYTPRSVQEDFANVVSEGGLRGPDGVPLARIPYRDGLGTNAPSPISDASELWFSALGSKGMFQTHFPDSGVSIEEAEDSTLFPVRVGLQKYGFQFMYNPNAISMNYLGVADTDVGRLASGQSKTNYIPNPGTTGGISFNILINRMFDMQYYRPIENGRAELVEGAESRYSPRAPYNKEVGTALGLFDEQSTIYNKGTMYDIEYLLRTIMGYTMKSQLRREFTADMGLFSRKPVDLHLGPKMRYRGYIAGINVSHTIFNERMVPVFSTVALQFNRYPDYTSAVDPNARGKDS